MAEHSSTEILIAICVAAWGIANIVFTAMNTINERRDTVITGYLKDRKLTADHRLMIVYHDWMPTLAGVLVLSLLGLAGLSILPLVVTDPHWKRLIPWLWIFTGPAFAFVAIKWISDGLKEYKLMMRSINLDPTATTSETQTQPDATTSATPRD